MPTMIEKALATAKTFEPGESEKLSGELAMLRAAYSNLLPAEAAAKEELIERIRLTEVRFDLSQAGAALKGLSLLDTSVFRWTKEQASWRRRNMKVPAFAYLPVDHHQVRLTARWTGGTTISPSGLPEAVHRAYDDMLTSISSRFLSFDGREEVTLTYTYPGVIPGHVKEIIKQEKASERFERLALVCEVDQWQTRWVQAPRQNLDPILVGERGGALWVLTSFDPTPLEKYLLNEFTVG